MDLHLFQENRRFKIYKDRRIKGLLSSLHIFKENVSYLREPEFVDILYTKTGRRINGYDVIKISELFPAAERGGDGRSNPSPPPHHTYIFPILITTESYSLPQLGSSLT
jgi:hypothetical protein